MRLNAVEAISLDLDDTLWPFAQAVAGAEDALRSWLIEHAPGTAGVLATREALGQLRVQFETVRPDLAGDYRRLRLGSIRMALEQAGEDVSLVETAYGVFFSARQKVEFFEDALPSLEWLSARFPLVAVTNGNADLQQTGGAHFFKGTLHAATVGVAKPDAAIFHAAAQMVDVAPRSMLHVGDDYAADVLGAIGAGMQAAWLVRDPSTTQAVTPRIKREPHLVIPTLTRLCEMLGRN